MLVEGSVIELRRSFAVATEDVVSVDEAGGLTRRGLDEETALQLGVWWSAYACRRGPLVDAVNLNKIALIGEAHDDGVRARELETRLKRMLFAAWRLQGHSVELGGARYDDRRDDLASADWSGLLDQIASDFGDLEASVAAVREGLS
jgi:hypothetical protein